MFRPIVAFDTFVKPEGLLHGWSIYLITEIELTDEGYRHLIVVVDCFAKWVEI